LRAAGTGVQRDAARLADGHFREDKEAADALLGGDGEIGEDDEIGNALVFDSGNDGNVSSGRAEGVGALRGDGEAEIVFAAQWAVGEAADERSGVEILDYGDAKFGHVRISSSAAGL
jgi:hypothetical protein